MIENESVGTIEEEEGPVVEHAVVLVIEVVPVRGDVDLETVQDGVDQEDRKVVLDHVIEHPENEGLAHEIGNHDLMSGKGLRNV